MKMPMNLRVSMCVKPLPFASGAGQEMFRHSDVIVFPELMDGGYRKLEDGTGVHTLRDDYVTDLRLASKGSDATIIAGSLALRGANGKLTNTSLVFRGSRIVHRYDKVHLFRATGDAKLFTPGNTIGVFTLRTKPLVKAGIVICYDLRFPELIRALARQGIAVLFVPARWPEVRDVPWRTLLKARAIENQIFVVGCNAVGAEGGHSYAYAPNGHVVFSSLVDPDETVRSFTLDLSEIGRAKRLHDNLREARYLHAMKLPAVLRGKRR
jgi:predicted amidohydrolase